MKPMDMTHCPKCGKPLTWVRSYDTDECREGFCANKHRYFASSFEGWEVEPIEPETEQDEG